MLQALFSSHSTSATPPLPDDSETFSTPPSTPTMSSSGSSVNSDVEAVLSTPNASVRPSLSRRNSRPTNLRLDHRASSDWTPDVLLETSPDVTKLQHANALDLDVNADSDKAGAHAVSREGGSEDRGRTSVNTGPRARIAAGNSVLNHDDHDSEGRAQEQLQSSSSHNPRSSVQNGSGSDAASAMPFTNPAADDSSSNQRQQLNHSSPTSYSQPMKSPCFVHSYLDKGASLADWLKRKQHNAHVGVAKSLEPVKEMPVPIPKMTNGDHSASTSQSSSSVSSPMDHQFDEEYDAQSLTRQLAETAAGVREMSKQLGMFAILRRRLISDSHVALRTCSGTLKHTECPHHHQSPRQSTDQAHSRARPVSDAEASLRRPWTCCVCTLPVFTSSLPSLIRWLHRYVDNQLRQSKRFDAEGIERDHPELFIPYPRRRSSSSISLSSMSSSGNQQEFNIKEEGQLRYWTSEMCNRTPELFDFVVTVCALPPLTPNRS
jgi:NAD+ kinase